MKRLACLLCSAFLMLFAASVRATFASPIELTDLPGIAVSANSFTEGGEPANAIDNLDYVDGQFSWVAGDHGTPEDPNWLQLDFGSDYYLTSVEVRFVYNDGEWDGYNNVFNLWAQQESGAWVAIGSGDVQDSADLSLRDKTFDYAPGAQPVARYLRYEVVGGSHWSSLGEINVQGTPYAVPEPSTFVLAALGILGLVLRRWRRLK
jgi:F5/8 type C domain/PEP-CTERM motif